MERLQSVEWGEFKLEDLFEVSSSKKKFDANKIHVLQQGKHPYIVRMDGNNGQKGFIDEDENFLNEGNTISFGQDTATLFYQEHPYFTGDKIKILKAKDSRFCKKNALFFIVALSKPFSLFSWGNQSFNEEVIRSQKISLPITSSGSIDYEFIDSFIAELQAYLTVTGLTDYILTEEERKTVEEYSTWQWKSVTYKSVFNKIVQGRRLKKEDQLPGDIPFVMSGTTNTGVVGYVSNPVASFPKNSITIDIFGNAFYRNYAFGAGDDTGVYWNDSKEYTKELMLFFTSVMEKSLHGKYSYGHKLRSSDSFDLEFQVPISKEDKPNYQQMSLLISAIQKLVIKGVVLYADRKIKATKNIVGCDK